jgi:hypothetical protein
LIQVAVQDSKQLQTTGGVVWRRLGSSVETDIKGDICNRVEEPTEIVSTEAFGPGSLVECLSLVYRAGDESCCVLDVFDKARITGSIYIDRNNFVIGVENREPEEPGKVVSCVSLVCWL